MMTEKLNQVRLDFARVNAKIDEAIELMSEGYLPDGLVEVENRVYDLDAFFRSLFEHVTVIRDPAVVVEPLYDPETVLYRFVSNDALSN